MTIRVTDTSDPTAWVIIDDVAQHEGTADPNTLSYGQNIDGSENPGIIVIPCPEPACDSVSYWPREALPPFVHEALPS
jgi:hypothetical protein